MLESFPREENEFLIALCSIFPVSGSFPRIIQALPAPNAFSPHYNIQSTVQGKTGTYSKKNLIVIRGYFKKWL